MKKFIIPGGLVCLLFLIGIVPSPCQSSNELIIDLVKLSPYASWSSSTGPFPFGRDNPYQPYAGYGENISTKEGEGRAQAVYISIPSNFGSGGAFVKGDYILTLPESSSLKLKIKADLEKGKTQVVKIKYQEYGEDVTGELLKESAPFDVEKDITFLKGKRVVVTLEVEGGNDFRQVGLRFTEARIISEYPEKESQDLSLGPSDISLRPTIKPEDFYADMRIQNLGNKASEESALFLLVDEKLVGEKMVPSILPKENKVITIPAKGIAPGRHQLTARITVKEDSGDNLLNNTAGLTTSTYRGPFIKRITREPFPWNCEKIYVQLQEKIDDLTDYSLHYSIQDYQGREVMTETKELSVVKDNRLVIVPFREKRTGWYEMEMELKYKDIKLDSLKTIFSRMPENKPLENPVFGLNSFLDRICLNKYEPTEEYKLLLRLYYDLGVGCLRIAVSLDPNGPTDFTKYDLLLGDISRQGHGILGLVYNEMSEAEVNSLENKAFEFVNRYKDRVKVWEVGNECDIGNGTVGMPVETYNRFLKAWSRGAKRADPGCTIVTAGLGGSSNQYKWLDKVYEECRDYFDCIGLHPYMNHAILDKNDYFFQAGGQPYNLYRDLIRKYGDEDKKRIWCTEYSWAAVTKSELMNQARYVVRAYLLAMPEQIPMFYFIDRDYSSDINNILNQEGLVYRDFSPKPSAVACAVMTNILGGATFIEKKGIGKNKFCYVFEKGGEKFAYIWKARGDDETLTLPAERKEIKTVTIMGEEKILQSGNNQTEIILSTDPIVVYGLALDKFPVLTNNVIPVSIETDGKKYETGLFAVKCPRAGIPVKIDGDIDDWKDVQWTPIDRGNFWRPCYQQEDKLNGEAMEWGGKDNISAKFGTKWDKDFLYVALDVTDDKDVPAPETTNPAFGWAFDSVILGIDPLLTGGERFDDDDLEMWFGRKNGQALSYVGKGADAGSNKSPNEETKAAVARDGGKNRTIYEIAIPRRQILGGQDFVKGNAFGLDILINDRDEEPEAAAADLRRGWLDPTGGEKNPGKFFAVKLE